MRKNSNPIVNKLAIKQFLQQRGHFPRRRSPDKEEQRLWKCLSNYVDKQGSAFDLDFRNWAEKSGYGSRMRFVSTKHYEEYSHD